MGLEHDPDEVYAEYADLRRDPWRVLVLPVLRDVPAVQLAEASGLHPRSIPAIQNGHRTPQLGTRAALARTAAEFARERLRERRMRVPVDDLASCAADLQRRRLTRL
ncbi:MAG: hypothetical protein M3354_09945 [Chloroflexota bacterium]|nr:hypothetical protein [Chloroflexota bacterium]